MIKDVLDIKAALRPETYEEWRKRFGLDEEKIAELQHGLE